MTGKVLIQSIKIYFEQILFSSEHIGGTALPNNYECPILHCVFVSYCIEVVEYGICAYSVCIVGLFLHRKGVMGSGLLLCPSGRVSNAYQRFQENYSNILQLQQQSGALQRKVADWCAISS